MRVLPVLLRWKTAQVRCGVLLHGKQTHRICRRIFFHMFREAAETADSLHSILNSYRDLQEQDL